MEAIINAEALLNKSRDIPLLQALLLECSLYAATVSASRSICGSERTAPFFDRQLSILARHIDLLSEQCKDAEWATPRLLHECVQQAAFFGGDLHMHTSKSFIGALLQQHREVILAVGSLAPERFPRAGEALPALLIHNHTDLIWCLGCTEGWRCCPQKCQHHRVLSK